MIAHLIGYPIAYPTDNPKGYPNRPRIARIGPYRPGPFNYLWSPLHHSSLSDARAAERMMTLRGDATC